MKNKNKTKQVTVKKSNLYRKKSLNKLKNRLKIN